MKQGEILRKLRAKRSITAKEVAESCEIPYNVYLAYENDKRTLGVSPLVRIAEFYGVSVDSLLGREVPDRSDEIEQYLAQIKELTQQIESLTENASKLI